MSSLLPTTPEGASRGAELVTSDGRSLALVSAQLHGEVQGGIARLVLEQKFHNTYDENLRVTYRMPLPADGAVSGYAFVIADRTIKGVVDRKVAARERFERAIASGKTAALLEQERADIFTQQIGNIPAKEAVIAQITIDQRLVWLPEGEWELRFPTVIGPRYIGSADTAADVRATHIKVTDRPLGANIQIALTIRDTIVGGAKPTSPSHALEKREDGTIELKSGSRLDRDIVVRWPVATPAVGLSLAAARPLDGSDAYGLLTIVPPAKSARAIAVPRDLIVLLDTSGSMGGFPLDKAKQVVGMLIDSLDEQDRFELIEFSDQPHRYKAEPATATARAKQEAIRWVRSREASGGTEMRAGVIEALQTLRVGAQRQVVVVTDGYVGGEQQILAALLERLPKSCRLHVLGVGSAVNRSFATSLSRAGRGVEVIVGVDEDVERGTKRLLDRTRAPMLTNVEISGSALLRHAPEQVPDVFEGAPLVAALALRATGGQLVVRGQLAREAWEHTLEVPAKRAGDGNQAIVALYGRERVADVEARGLFDSIDGEIEDLGLTFQIATRKTSWVAVDETRIVTGPTREQLIPQELPYGTQASAFGLRSAAPPSPGFAGGPSFRELARARMPQMDAMHKLEIDDGGDAPEEYGESPPARRSMAVDVTESAPEDEFAADEPTDVSKAVPSGFATRAGVLRGAPPSPGGRLSARPPMAPQSPSSPAQPAPMRAKQKAEEPAGEDDTRTTGQYPVVEDKPVAAAPQMQQASRAEKVVAAKPAPAHEPETLAEGKPSPADKPEMLAAAPAKLRKKTTALPLWGYLVFALLIAALIWWFLR